MWEVVGVGDTSKLVDAYLYKTPFFFIVHVVILCSLCQIVDEYVVNVT